MNRFKNFKPRKSTAPEVTMTPLIDTFATLLLIFIVAAPMVQNGIKVDLPQGKIKEVGNQQDLVVTLSKDGKVYFNNFPVPRNTLVSSVQKAIAQKEDTPVYVHADETVRYGKVIEVVDELKLAGVKYVAMSTKP
jgi:biopolymer transport protein TolR